VLELITGAAGEEPVSITVTTLVDWTVTVVVHTQPAGAPGLEAATGAAGLEPSGWGITGMTLVMISMVDGGVVVITAVHAVQVDVQV